MAEVTTQTYILAGAFAVIGAVAIWAIYRLREIPADKRPSHFRRIGTGWTRK